MGSWVLRRAWERWKPGSRPGVGAMATEEMYERLDYVRDLVRRDGEREEGFYPAPILRELAPIVVAARKAGMDLWEELDYARRSLDAGW